MSSKFATQRIEKLEGECELTRYIGEKDNPDFDNSWVNFGSTLETAGFYKDKFNRVWLQGTIKSGSVPGVAFTLPEGYRSSNQLSYSTVDGTGTPSGRVRVDPDGDVNIQAGNNGAISLDGVSWRA